jgi:peptidoglycan/LPS O-acetylase OafA/YrhL
MPACLAAIGVVSILSYRYVERPFLRGSRASAPLVTAAA